MTGTILAVAVPLVCALGPLRGRSPMRRPANSVPPSHPHENLDFADTDMIMVPGLWFFDCRQNL